MKAQALGIIADDLTGAMDSSGHLASLGLSTAVILDSGFDLTADVVVIDTNSRADDANTAREKVRQAVRNLRRRIVYKKIDSALRGNIGVELKEIIEELAPEKVIVAPAFPAVGRTTLNGTMLVEGIDIAETQFASEPVSPVKESHIPSLLEQAIQRPVGCVPVKYIDAGPEALYREISRMSQDILVCDVITQSQLNCIAQTAALAKGYWLLCGSGGLARELHLLLTRVPVVRKTLPSNLLPGPVLTVVGTRNQVTADQLLKAKDKLGLPILNLEVGHIKEKDISPAVVAQIVDEADCLLSQGTGLAISSVFSHYVSTLEQSVAAIMAEAAIAILALRKFAGIFLSGGDIAIEVCRRLSVSAILVHGEIEPGVPAGDIIGGQGQGMRIVTKAGSFGTETALIKSILYLEKGNLP